MISESFKYMFNDENWKKKLAIGGIIGAIPILNLALYGYMIDTIKLVLGGVEDKSPEFNIVNQFIEGIIGIVIISIYIIIPISLLIIGYVFLGGSFLLILDDKTAGLGVMMMLIFILFLILYMLCSILFALIIPIALSHYVNTGKLSSIFEFKTLFSILKKTWLDILIFYIILTIAIVILEVIIYMVALIFAMTVILIPVAIWIFGMLMYYITTVSGYFYGKIYLKGVNELNK
ncbi:DUF4013 domain-containing protein [Methanococcus aeolicus]|uniref:DUF4013 domain-containing protein n=1 Tax=Methanococcus aeolicus (strain ATCC BAA-1280 / DSM 17508 / OCM 812 / Nankai-3) TaxID=419665 RepID=A6UW19_META3|nr:DUF4013 domain-containing protein [Methanococcus aeolicus]ABR56691.1 hypothetical protein Maeo_1114 [Methanococcus aeolicus Nankai-3]UXM84692.1 DUF4013 domain-containing protein [Methanococcus aeolicus]